MRVELLMLLLFSLLSPIVEAFPNLYMSWWVPSNGKFKKYIDTWIRRVVIVFIVWLPILVNLERVVDNSIIVWFIATLVFSAFGLRMYFFDKFLKQKIKGGKSKNKLSKIPEYLYFLAFSSIGLVLFKAVPNNQWLVPMAIFSIFFGAYVIGRFREGKQTNIKLDIAGRVVFILGFLLNLYNLFRSVVYLFVI